MWLCRGISMEWTSDRPTGRLSHLCRARCRVSWITTSRVFSQRALKTHTALCSSVQGAEMKAITDVTASIPTLPISNSSVSRFWCH